MLTLYFLRKYIFSFFFLVKYLRGLSLKLLFMVVLLIKEQGLVFFQSFFFCKPCKYNETNYTKNICVGKQSKVWLHFYMLTFISSCNIWSDLKLRTLLGKQQGNTSNFFYSVFESAPQTIVVVFCLLSFLNLSYCIGNATYKNLSYNIKYFKTFLERLKSVRENSMPE